MSLISFIKKVPSTHFIKSRSLRSDASSVTLSQLVSRFPENDLNQNKLLALLLTDLNLPDYTDEELLSLLNINWTFLELRGEHRQLEKLNPLVSRYQTDKGVTDYLLSEKKQTKEVNLKSYLIHNLGI